MPRDIDLTFDISTGALTLDRVVGNYVKRSETLTLSVTIVSNGASATIPSGLVGTLKPVNTYGTTLAQWTTFSQVGATNVYTASTTINAAAVTTLLGTTTEQANCVFDFAGAGVVESDTLALVLKNNVTRDDDTAPTALLNRNDFLVTNGTGLLVNVAAGYAANGAFVAAQASLAITNATNYIEVTAAGVASVNTTAFTAGSYPLATVVASAGAITANTDLRAWITPKPAAAGGVTSITGTANEITVTGTTTPTLSLPSALTFTAKTITGGTFASPSLTTPTIGDGTEAAPSLSFASDTDTGVYRPAADTVGIVGGGHDIVRLTDVASATDYLEIKNAIGVSTPLHVLASGPSTNIGMHLQPKGSGLLTISDGTDFNKGIRFRSSSSAASAITLLDAVSTAGRVITLPDATGTLALVSGALGTPASGDFSTGAFIWPTFDQNTTGSAATLTTTRTIGGSNFDGSADVTSFPSPGPIGGTTPSTIAGTTGTFSGDLITTGANAQIYTSGAAAYLATYGDAAHIYTDGANAQIYTSGLNARISTGGANAHISTGSSGAHIQTRSTFKLFGGTYYTTLSHAATADRAIAFPDAAGTLLLADGSGANLTALNASNVSSGTLAAARGGTGVSNTGTITLGGNLVTTGAFNTTFAQAATTTVTLPATSATMARTDAAQTFTGVQSMTSPDITTSITTPSTTFAIANATATTLNIGGAATTIAMGAAGAGTMNIPLTTSASSAITGSLKIGNGTAATNVGIGGGNIVAGGTISSQYFSQTNGRITITSAASTGSRLTVGTTSGWIVVDSTAGAAGAILLGAGSAHPGIFKSGTTLQVRLADNSADAPISASNVTASGTLAVTGATTLTGNLTSNGAYISTPQALSGNGAVAAVNLTTEVTTIANTGTENTTTTLAAGTNGQKKVISFITDGGFDAVITVTNPAWGGAGTITMNDALDNIELRYLNSVWQVFINNGCTLA